MKLETAEASGNIKFPVFISLLTEATFVGGNKINGRNAEDEAENSNNYKTCPIKQRNKW